MHQPEGLLVRRAEEAGGAKKQQSRFCERERACQGAGVVQTAVPALQAAVGVAVPADPESVIADQPDRAAKEGAGRAEAAEREAAGPGPAHGEDGEGDLQVSAGEKIPGLQSPLFITH